MLLTFSLICSLLFSFLCNSAPDGQDMKIGQVNQNQPKATGKFGEATVSFLVPSFPSTLCEPLFQAASWGGISCSKRSLMATQQELQALHACMHLHQIHRVLVLGTPVLPFFPF